MAAYIIVVGHGPELEREDGAVSLLRALGAQVRPMDLWDEPSAVAPAEGDSVRAVIIEGIEAVPTWLLLPCARYGASHHFTAAVRS